MPCCIHMQAHWAEYHKEFALSFASFRNRQDSEKKTYIQLFYYKLALNV